MYTQFKDIHIFFRFTNTGWNMLNQILCTTYEEAASERKLKAD